MSSRESSVAMLRSFEMAMRCPERRSRHRHRRSRTHPCPQPVRIPPCMFAVALVLACLSAMLHVYIFVRDSFRWEAPDTRPTYGVFEDAARVKTPLDFNQGY